MKKVAVVTGSRAEYGIMKTMMQKLSHLVELDVIVTAMHMEERYGYTYRQIEADGFHISAKIPLHLKDTSKKTLAKSLSILAEKLSSIFEEKNYDLLIILGDRYEMLPVANTALIYNIPICHIHGGEKTLGNFDEMIRHAITKMSHLHLVATQEFKDRIIQLGENPAHVHHIGSMGVENVLNQDFVSPQTLSEELGIELKNPYYVVLFHPVTLEKGQAAYQVSELLSAISHVPAQFLFIGSNSDTDSDVIMAKIESFVQKNQASKIFPSLPTQYYHSLIKHSNGLIGNSSSGLIEVPSLGVPTLNIGNRQLGRLRGPSVVDVDVTASAILDGFNQLEKIDDFTNYYEKADSSDLAVQHIIQFLEEEDVLMKDFFDRH